MKILKLTLKKEWFDMILSGKKKEEYRVIKQYWKARLLENDNDFKKYDAVEFKNGYGKNVPTMLVECLGIGYNNGLREWGATEDENKFVIYLGKVISSKNLK